LLFKAIEVVPPVHKVCDEGVAVTTSLGATVTPAATGLAEHPEDEVAVIQ
jgi:hypothetical protein